MSDGRSDGRPFFIGWEWQITNVNLKEVICVQPAEVLELTDRLVEELLDYPELAPDIHERLVIAFAEPPWKKCPYCGSHKITVAVRIERVSVVARLSCEACGAITKTEAEIPTVSVF